MPILRFPNSQSDLGRLVSQLSLVASNYSKPEDLFSLDDIRDVLSRNNQISSNGASGALAVKRSTRPDRSRDPLYNQVKMMSEVYRMFGWIRSVPGKRLLFRMTHLGLALSLDAHEFGQEYRRGLIRESIIRVVFPNETTKNVGIVNHRPFSWLLRLAKNLDGFITRDELIIGMLATTNDLEPGRLASVSNTLHKARTEASTGEMVKELARLNQIQENTLKNYTRLPIGVLSSPLVGWAVASKRIFGPSSSTLNGFSLTPLGIQTSSTLENSFDLRIGTLSQLSDSERKTLAEYSFYMLLLDSGMPIEKIRRDITRHEAEALSVMERIGFKPGQKLVYNPELQEIDSILSKIGGA